MSEIEGVLSGASRWHVAQGDCLDVLRSLPDASVDAVVTDPPYAATGAASSIVAKGKRRSVPREYQFYEAWLREHLAEIDRIMRPAGALWLTIDWRGAMALDQACARLGLSEPKIGVWNRGGLGMGYVLRNTYECFAVVTWPEWKRRRADEPDVWDHKWTPANRHHAHSAEKPVDLYVRALSLVASPGGIVLDPFAGSGTAGGAARREGFRFIGVERETQYVEIARARIAAEASPAQAALPGAA